MPDPQSTLPTYHRPADVARMLRCSEWWVKEQARRRRIPYSWIGGSYLFTDEHILTIVRLFEVQPIESSPVIAHRRPVIVGGEVGAASVVSLHARIPRRARSSTSATAA